MTKNGGTSMLQIPESFMSVPYVGARYPGAPGVKGVEGGANCQQYAYTLLRYFGREIPDFRSSDLWEDRLHTELVTDLQPLDLLLWNDRDQSWGAHVGLYLGDGQAVHLAQSIGRPVVWPLARFVDTPAYRVFIGAKRVLNSSAGG